MRTVYETTDGTEVLITLNKDRNIQITFNKLGIIEVVELPLPDAKGVFVQFAEALKKAKV